MEEKKSDFKTLLQALAAPIPKVGDVIKGVIVAIDRGVMHIDIPGLTTGVVRGQELFAESKEYADLKVGDSIEATVMELENENGEMELSFRMAGSQRAWERVRQLQREGATITARIISANKGGLMMQVEALQGFMPVSQLAPEHYPRVAGGDKNKIFERLKELIGVEFSVKVIDVLEPEEKLIVSERAVWEEAQRSVLAAYHVGDIIEGVISALTSFGAFMKFGAGLEGLIHISEIAWQRIDHPKDILKVGQAVKVQIIQLDHSKIYLSIKRTVEDPWKRVRERYAVGAAVRGTVVKVEPFGLMVALDPEIHGLAHVSELSDAPLANLAEKFKVGGQFDFEVVSLEPAEHRLGLKLAGVKGKRGRGGAPAPAGEAAPAAPAERVVAPEPPAAPVEAVALPAAPPSPGAERA